RAGGERQTEPERENLRQAMRWALDRGESEASLLLASAYARLCGFRGPFGEGQRWLEAALQTGGEQAPAARARAMRGVAGLAERQGDLEQAQAFAESSLSLARSIGDDTLTGEALLVLGLIAVDA